MEATYKRKNIYQHFSPVIVARFMLLVILGLPSKQVALVLQGIVSIIFSGKCTHFGYKETVRCEPLTFSENPERNYLDGLYYSSFPFEFPSRPFGEGGDSICSKNISRSTAEPPYPRSKRNP